MFKTFEEILKEIETTTNGVYSPCQPSKLWNAQITAAAQIYSTQLIIEAMKERKDGNDFENLA